MKCPNCNETDHEDGAKFCHVCGAKLTSIPPTTKKKSSKGAWIVALFLLFTISIVEWLMFEEDSTISIVWNVIMFVGFMSDWYKFQDDTILNRIKPYFFMVPMSVTVCIVETMLFDRFGLAIIISILVILVLTSLLFKRQKK